MPRSWLVRAALALFVVSTLAGCRLDASLEVVIDADGGGDLELSFDVNEALASEAAAAGLDPIGAIAAAGAELDPWQVEVADDGRAVTLSGSFADAEALESAAGDLADTLAQPELTPLEPLDIDVAGDEVTVTGGASLAPSGAVADVGFDPDEAVAELDQSVDYRVAVTMPGDVVAHEGGVRDGRRRVLWAVPAGQDVTIAATGQRPTGLTPVQIAVLAAAVAAVGALLLAAGLALRRR